MPQIKELLLKAVGYVRDRLNRVFLLPKLREEMVLARFGTVRKKYLTLCGTLSGTPLRENFRSNPLYSWGSWTENIRKAFEHGVPPDFLSVPVLTGTMVYGRNRGKAETDRRIPCISEVFGDKTAALLREDFPGLPNITDSRWLTSANRALHAFHLAFYRRITGADFWSSPVILEWGGGYGNMARLIKKLNPGATYIIVDLPELLALQYIYLYSILGPEVVNPACGIEAIVEGRINFVPYSAVMGKKLQLNCDGFVSTWAITESPFEAQDLVLGSKCFGAKKALLAYAKGDGNKFETRLMEIGLKEEPAALQPGHAYAFR